MRRILITGGLGFIGSKLTTGLVAKGYLVSSPKFDLLSASSVNEVVCSQNWDAVIHLAAMSHMMTCEKDPAAAYRVNLSGTALLLDAIQTHCPQSHFIFASSAQVYRAPRQGETNAIIFAEDHPISPQNIYARTKYAGELLIRDASERWGLKTTILRLFNHTHRSQSSEFFLPHLYSAMLAFADRGEGSILVGNLDLYRDLGSLDDLVRAFISVLETAQTPRGEQTKMDLFNVCSGSPKNLRLLAGALAKRLNLNVRFELDPTRIRPGELKSVMGSHLKLSQATGWQPNCVTEEDLLTAFLA